MYGYTAVEAHGQSIRLIIPPDREHEDAEVVGRVRHGERVPPFDTVRRHKDGSPHRHLAHGLSDSRRLENKVVGASKWRGTSLGARHTRGARAVPRRARRSVRPLSDAEAITVDGRHALGEHLEVNRCAYATVEEDEDALELTGNYTDGVESIVGRYPFRQFGEECLRLIRAGEPYVVFDAVCRSTDFGGGTALLRMSAVRAVVCVPLHKAGLSRRWRSIRERRACGLWKKSIW